MNKLLPDVLKKALNCVKKGFFYTDLTFKKSRIHRLNRQIQVPRLSKKETKNYNVY